ncbi:hypothetical protein ACSFBX_34125 [Variovorax sp. RB2P76]|uniref:hypothetical protein n=1 Tax=Variovorax sp. RB2P76 TaxID=3443736 RepID=UPI003F446862
MNALDRSDRKLLQKTFSVYRYGDDAQKLAIAERQKQLEQIVGPCARLFGKEDFETVRTNTPVDQCANGAPA